MLALAGGKPCGRNRKQGCRLLDGRSLAPLLRGRTSSIDDDRALLVEYRGNGNLGLCAYSGVRVPGATYLEHTRVLGSDGRCKPASEREHYRLGDDQFQLSNLIEGSPGGELEAEQDALAARLDRLRDCAGAPGGKRKRGRSRCE